MTRECYAAPLGGCSGKIDREHLISRNLLSEFESDGGIRIKGYPLGNSAGDIPFSADSLSARILCQGHNSKLSAVDSAGGAFVKAIYDCHRGLLSEKCETDLKFEVDGLLVERWMLKYACGLVATGQAARGGERFTNAPPPVEFLQVLFGLETLPDAWGLYVKPTKSVGYSESKGLELGLFMPRINGMLSITGVIMRHYGFTSVLALQTPDTTAPGSELDGTIFRPAFFEFSYAATGRTALIILDWPTKKSGDGFTIELGKGRPPVDPHCSRRMADLISAKADRLTKLPRRKKGR